MGRFGRRYFIAGAGATAAGLAFGLRHSRASFTGPKRFIFVVSGNGYDASITMGPTVRQWINDSRGTPVDDGYWWGEHGSGRYDENQPEVRVVGSALSGSRGLSRLESAGLLNQTAMLYGLTSRCGGGHSSFHGVLSTVRNNVAGATGPTIDHLLSELPSVRGEGDGRTPIAAIRIGSGRQGGLGFGLCAPKAANAFPVNYSLTSSWRSLVEPFVADNGGEQLAYQARLLRVAHTNAIGRFEATGSEHAERMAQGAASEIEANERLTDLVSARRGTLTAPPLAPAENMTVAERHQQQADVLVSAMEAGLSRVGVFSLGAGQGGWQFPYRDVEDSRHGTLYHAVSDEAGEASAAVRREQLRTIWTRELDVIGNMADKLNSIPDPEGSGSMLDNTVIVYLPDNGLGHHGNAREFPTLLIGGANLGLNTNGRALFYPDSESDSPGRRGLANLFSTLGVTIGCGETASDGCLQGLGNPSARFAGGVLNDLIAS